MARRSTQFIILIALFLLPTNLFSKQISVIEGEVIARKVANFKNTKKTSSLSLVYTAKQKQISKTNNAEVNYYYVFNIGENNGFVIVSADDLGEPIIGYSNKGQYDPNNLPENFKLWMSNIEAGMEKAILENVESKAIRAKWSNLSDNGVFRSANAVVSPLVKTAWGQREPYNNKTPIYNSTATYTGCVATAMAQIMKYHEHPKVAAGTGTLPAYTSKTLGLNMPSLDLTQDIFDWGNMLNVYSYYSGPAPTSLEEDAVAKLMYYCGLSTKMDYDVIGTEGSAASTYDVAASLYKHFDYDKDIDFLFRSSSSDEEWMNVLKNELDSNRPVLYSGYSSVRGGHAFICDGYDDMGLFHFNWGWGGSQDGFYNVNVPLDFTEGHNIVINIKPNEGGTGIPRFVVSGYNNYPSSVRRNETFRLDCSVSDMSIHFIDTYFHIGLYDESDNFIEIINFEDYISNSSTSANRCQVSASVPAGSYKVKAVLPDGQGGYTPISLREGVEYPIIEVGEEILKHSLKLRDNTPLSSTITSGEVGDQFSVSLSFGNTGTAKFLGDCGMALVDADGITIRYLVAEDLDISLSRGSYYPSYPFYFCKLPMDVLPGDYKLMMCARESVQRYVKDISEEWGVVHGLNEAVIEYLDFKVIGNVTDIDNSYLNEPEIFVFLKEDILHIRNADSLKYVGIYDTTGKVVLRDLQYKDGINISHLPKGIYLVKIETREGVLTKKINK